MSMQTTNTENTLNHWIPILDYAVLRGVSTSTLRRYIKAKKIQYKVENGRYLLLADAHLAQQYAEKQQPAQFSKASRILSSSSIVENSQAQSISVFLRVRELEDQLLQANEQVNELKMLVAIYEEKLSQSGH